MSVGQSTSTSRPRQLFTNFFLMRLYIVDSDICKFYRKEYFSNQKQTINLIQNNFICDMYKYR